MEQHLTALFNNGVNDGDIIFTSCDNVYVHCHSFIFIYTTGYGNDQEKLGNMFDGIKSLISSKILIILFNKLYCSTYVIKDLNIQEITDLITTLDKFQVCGSEKIMKELGPLFIKQITEENWSNIFTLSMKFDVYQVFRPTLVEYFIKNIAPKYSTIDNNLVLIPSDKIAPVVTLEPSATPVNPEPDNVDPLVIPVNVEPVNVDPLVILVNVEPLVIPVNVEPVVVPVNPVPVIAPSVTPVNAESNTVPTNPKSIRKQYNLTTNLHLRMKPNIYGEVDVLKNKTRGKYIVLGGNNSQKVINKFLDFLYEKKIWYSHDDIVWATKQVGYVRSGMRNISRFAIRRYKEYLEDEIDD